jgi:hypothetical protein
MDWRELSDNFGNGNARSAQRAARPHTQLRHTGIFELELLLHVSAPMRHVTLAVGSEGHDLPPRPSKRRGAKLYKYFLSHLTDGFAVRRRTRDERRRAVDTATTTRDAP